VFTHPAGLIRESFRNLNVRSCLANKPWQTWTETATGGGDPFCGIAFIDCLVLLVIPEAEGML
jgi:hypothetical protein